MIVHERTNDLANGTQSFPYWGMGGVPLTSRKFAHPPTTTTTTRENSKKIKYKTVTTIYIVKIASFMHTNVTLEITKASKDQKFSLCNPPRTAKFLVPSSGGKRYLGNPGTTLLNQAKKLVKQVKKVSQNTKIVFSSIIIQKDRKNIDKKANSYFKKLLNVYFFGNSNLKEKHLVQKKLPLNKKGNSILANNFLKYL